VDGDKSTRTAQPDVEDCDVWSQRCGKARCVQAVIGLSDDVEFRMSVENSLDRITKQWMVIHEHHRDWT
jgi:hypothetical protein